MTSSSDVIHRHPVPRPPASYAASGTPRAPWRQARAGDGGAASIPTWLFWDFGERFEGRRMTWSQIFYMWRALFCKKGAKRLVCPLDRHLLALVVGLHSCTGNPDCTRYAALTKILTFFTNNGRQPSCPIGGQGRVRW
jgi:hypothetical protein